MARLEPGPLASVLESNRSVLNARFADVAAGLNESDRDQLATRYSRSLIEVVDPVVRKLEQGTLNSVAFELTKIALDLSASRVMSDVISVGWQRLIPLASQLLATSAPRFLAGVTNALTNIESVGTARPLVWIENLERVLHVRKDLSIEMFERVGVLAAWRSGMPNYREAAMRHLGSLDAQVASLAIGCTNELSTEHFARTVSEPWFDPSTGQSISQPIRVGNFRGLGGQFERPPVIVAGVTEAIVTDGTTDWHLLADHVGAFLQRVGDRTPAMAPLANNERHAPMPGVVGQLLPEPTSWLQTDTTIFATSASSFSVTVIPLA